MSRPLRRPTSPARVMFATSSAARSTDVDEEDDGRRGEAAELVHALRQPLSTLLLLVDRAQQIDLPDDAAEVVAQIAQQVDELVSVTRKISRLVE